MKQAILVPAVLTLLLGGSVGSVRAGSHRQRRVSRTGNFTGGLSLTNPAAAVLFINRGLAIRALASQCRPRPRERLRP